MEIPKYIKKKILDRAKLQRRANVLQQDIDDWCKSHGIETEYSKTHICLLTEPSMVAVSTIEEIEEKGEKQ